MKLFLILFLLITTTLLSEEVKPQVAVLEISNETIQPQEAIALTEKLIHLLSETDEYVILERGMVNVILEEQGFQQSGCIDGACAVEVGQMLGVQKMLSCKVGIVGRYHTVSLKMVDVETGKIDKSVSHDVLGTIETVLLSGMKEAVGKLVGTTVEPEKSKAKREPKQEIVLTPEEQYNTAVKKKKTTTILLGTSAGITAGVAGVFWAKKFSLHNKYLDSDNQNDMDDYIKQEETATIIASVATGATVALLVPTIIIARKEIEKPGVKVSFAPIFSNQGHGLMITGKF